MSIATSVDVRGPRNDEMLDALIGIALAIGVNPGDMQGPLGLVEAVREHVNALRSTHDSTLEDLAYARNELHDLTKRVEELENTLLDPGVPGQTYGPLPHGPRRRPLRWQELPLEPVDRLLRQVGHDG